MPGRAAVGWLGAQSQMLASHSGQERFRQNPYRASGTGRNLLGLWPIDRHFAIPSSQESLLTRPSAQRREARVVNQPARFRPTEFSLVGIFIKQAGAS